MTLYSLSILGFVLLLTAVAWRLRSMKARQGLLLCACYVFYAGWGVAFLPLLIASSLINFALGALLRRRQTTPYLWLGIGFNILFLGFYKYLPPILMLSGSSSWQSDLAQSIVMPIGMSFWTFQAISHQIDIYLEENVDPSLVEFCLYMAFWPTVLSGPLCRLPQMLPQFRRALAVSAEDLSTGALFIVQGVFMKMYLAQLLGSGWEAGQGVAAGFDQMTAGWGAIDVWLLGIGFGFLLFFDFAGYSLMAIGAARLFGIRVAENFDRPFLSTTPTAFWNRWHMSLSFWIRDYVFKPLAFMRRESWWRHVAVIVSMTLFGLWHGPRWTFVAFGIYHGVLLVSHRLGQQLTARMFRRRLPGHFGSVLSWATTFAFVALGFVLFRANDLAQGMAMARTVFSPAAYQQFAMPASFYFLTGGVVAAYFACIAAESLFATARARYITSGHVRIAGLHHRQALWSSPMLAVGAVVDILTARLWWWFAPALVSLTLLVAASLYMQDAVVRVTPFIYTLF